METWEDIRVALDALLRLLALGLIGLAGWAIKTILPLALAALREAITSWAMERWTRRADEAAATIVDPRNPASSVPAEAAKMVAGIPDAAKALGAEQADAARAIERRVSLLRTAPLAGSAPPAGPREVIGR